MRDTEDDRRDRAMREKAAAFEAHERQDAYRDDDLVREAIDERRARARQRGCACGNPDWPGQCPGPMNCPVNNYGNHEDDEP